MHTTEKLLAGALGAVLLSAPCLAGPTASRPTATRVALQTTPVQDANDEDDSAGKATGAAMTLDEAFAAMKTYKFGDSRQPIRTIGGAIRDASPADRPALAKRVAALIQPGMPVETMKFACRQLRILGDPATVPTLAALLTTTDENLAHFARYALEPMQSPAAGAALRDALPRANGPVKIGIIGSLGARRDTAAVPELAKLTKATDTAVAAAALDALGRIGGSEALAAVRAARASAPVKRAAEQALLRLADDVARTGGDSAALIAELASSDDPAIRAGALRRQVLAGNLATLTTALTDNALRPVALGAVTDMPVAAAGQLVSRFSSLPPTQPSAQAALTTVLAARADAASIPGLRAAVTLGASSPDPALRLAALEALGTVGDAATIPPLAAAAAEGTKEVAAVATRSLERLRGTGIDEAMVAAARTATGPRQIALIRALGSRRASAALPLLTTTIEGTDSAARVAAFESMGMIATEADIPGLLNLLPRAASGKESQTAEKAVVVAANRLPDPANRANAVLAALPSASAATRPALLRILGAIGGPKALTELRAGIAGSDADTRDAAIRALAASTDVAAVPDLLLLVKEAPNETHRVLALRGLVRLASSTELKNGQRLQILRDTMAVAPANGRSEVLAGIGGISSTDALKLATSYLDDTVLREEAAAATLRIAKAVLGNSPKAASSGVKKTVRESIEKVQSVSTSDATRTQADEIVRSMG